MIIKIITGLFFYLSPAKNAYSSFNSIIEINNKNFLERKIYFLFCFLLFLSISFAQKKDSVDYFPLNVGDIRIYYHSLATYCNLPYVGPAQIFDYYYTSRTLDTFIFNNNKYYIIDTFYWSPDTVRINENGNLVLLNWGNEIELFKFTAKEGESWPVSFKTRSNSTYKDIIQLISRNNTISTPAGQFADCLWFWTHGTSEYSSFFAPNIGRVFKCGQTPITLFQAKIDNIKYPKPNKIVQKKIAEKPSFILSQNYPNPFNSSTVIEYMIPQKGHIKLIIYDILGREIKVLADELNYAGKYQKNWDGRDKSGKTVNASIYYCKLIVNGYSLIKKLLFIK